MNEITAVAAGSSALFPDPVSLSAPTASPAVPASFEQMLVAGLEAADAKVARSDTLVRQFAIDDTIPVHQVTIALEEARIAVELAMQVRARIVEGYRELMNMQL